METKSGTQEIKVYGYRWVVLLVFMFIQLIMQTFWICYAPITKVAAEAYGVSDMEIGLLAMLFMYIYIPLAIPASWAIDTWGFKKALGLGAVMMGVFGLLRGLFTQDYTMALIMTIGLAAAQPLFLNSGTKMVANWFPLGERATIIGLAGISQLLGIVIGQIATPFMVQGWGLGGAMLIYGIVGVVSALLFILFAREKPPTPAGYEERVLMLDGLKHIVRMRDFYLLAFIVFVPQQYAINLQLLGGILILQTLPAVATEIAPERIEVDLGGVRTIRAVEFAVRWHYQELGGRIAIEASGDRAMWSVAWEDWTGGPALAAAIASPLLVPVRIALPDVRARYLRIHPAPQWLAREVKVISP